MGAAVETMAGTLGDWYKDSDGYEPRASPTTTLSGSAMPSSRHEIKTQCGRLTHRLLSRFDAENHRFNTELSKRPAYRAQRTYVTDVALSTYPEERTEHHESAEGWQDRFLTEAATSHMIIDREAELMRQAALENTERDRVNSYEARRRELLSHHPRRVADSYSQREGAAYYARFREPELQLAENPYSGAAESAIQWKTELADREMSRRHANLSSDQFCLRERYLASGSPTVPKYNPYLP